MDMHSENKQMKALCQTKFFNCCHIPALMLTGMWTAFGSAGTLRALNRRPWVGS